MTDEIDAYELTCPKCGAVNAIGVESEPLRPILVVNFACEKCGALLQVSGDTLRDART